MHVFRFSLLLTLPPVLFACSGGGPKEPPPAFNTPPQLTSETQIEVEENHRGTFFTLSASDADGDPLRFAIAGADAEYFALEAETGALRFLQPPDFEAPADANGDNRYELIAEVEDGRGGRDSQALTVAVTNVEFAYEFLSPLADTIVERERYSRLPIALWMEYDYPERVEIKCDDEILNPASSSRMTWTGSIRLGTGRVMVTCVFWRGAQAFEALQIPVRHQYVISDDRYLVYDEVNDQFMIPHPQRLEALLIDAATGEPSKRYPWAGVTPPLQDIVADGNLGGALYTAAGAVQRLEGSGNDVASVTGLLDSAIPAQLQSTLSYDAVTNRLYASGTDFTYAQIDLASGAVSEASYAGNLAKPASSRVETALDAGGNRLFFASAAATGVEVVEPGGQRLAHYPFNQPQRWGDMVYEPNRDQLFISAWSDHQVMRLDLASGDYRALTGNGPALNTPRSLALDHQRDRLATLSGPQLIALDPDTGTRSVMFDASVGPGATTGGFAGIWVAADSTRARAIDRAIDRHLGRFYQIDLRSGQMTAKTYPWADTAAARDFQVGQAKFNKSGEVAAVHYQTRSLDAAENYLDLVFLDSESSQRLVANAEVVDFSFSRPDDQLMVLLHDRGQYSVATYALADGSVLAREDLTVAPGFTPLALQKINDELYLLGRNQESAIPVFQLVSIGTDQLFKLVTSYGDFGTGQNEGAGINSLYHDSVLAILLPEQAPHFWDRLNGGEFYMDFSTFRGSDQPKDFYTIDDYSELYFFRDRAGLHLCWRSHCAIQAN